MFIEFVHFSQKNFKQSTSMKFPLLGSVVLCCVHVNNSYTLIRRILYEGSVTIDDMLQCRLIYDPYSCYMYALIFSKCSNCMTFFVVLLNLLFMQENNIVVKLYCQPLEPFALFVCIVKKISLGNFALDGHSRLLNTSIIIGWVWIIRFNI